MALDLDKVERIVLNLLSNAVKFTNSEGEIKVLLYENEKSFFISVKDNGIGIPEDKLDLIFERFTQVERSLNRSHEGSGIGLALVKSMAELHGGTVTVVSQQGLGSEFILELPITSVERTAEYGVHQSRCERDVVERINIEFSDIYS